MAAPGLAPSSVSLSFLPTNQGSDFTVIGLDTARVSLEFDKADEQGAAKPGADEKDQDDKFSRTVDYALMGQPARVQDCSCYEGRARSLTARCKYEYKDAALVNQAPENYCLISGYHPGPNISKPGNDPFYMVSTYEECRVVFRALGLNEYKDEHGLLIVSGSTNSMKTKLVLGLINMLLEEMMKKWFLRTIKRKPHLVTCEDNIEQYFIEPRRLKPIEYCFKPSEIPFQKNFWFTHDLLPDYTPRKLNVDTPSLRDAIRDALRMTPAVFYGGEIRNKADWRHLYHLSQSHLVVVTTHSSSIVNTFSLLRDSMRINSPAQRSDLASSIFAIVHMRGGKLPICRGSAIDYVLPACWMRTAASVAGFAADGMASIVPHFVDLHARDFPKPSCIGRRSFARELARIARSTDSEVPSGHWFKWKEWDRRKFLPNAGGTSAGPQPFSKDDVPNQWVEQLDEGKCRRIKDVAEYLKCKDVRCLEELAATWDLRGE